MADQTDVYLRLNYRQYYHKAIRLDIGALTLEVQGPAVREAIREDHDVD